MFWCVPVFLGTDKYPVISPKNLTLFDSNDKSRPHVTFKNNISLLFYCFSTALIAYKITYQVKKKLFYNFLIRDSSRVYAALDQLCGKCKPEANSNKAYETPKSIESGSTRPDVKSACMI